MSTQISQNVHWAPAGREATDIVITRAVEAIDLETTRIAFSVPRGDEDTIIRVRAGRLYRRFDLPETIVSTKNTLREVQAEVFGPLERAFIAEGLLWTQCSEPGYAVSADKNSVKVQTVIPMTGHYPDLFSVREPEAVQAEALELALDAGLSGSVPEILRTPIIFVAEGAPVSRPTIAEKHAARAARLDAALQVAASLKNAPAEDLDWLLALPR